MPGRGRKSLEKMLSQVGSMLGALGTAIYAKVLIFGVMDASETQSRRRRAKHPLLRVQQADTILPTGLLRLAHEPRAGTSDNLD